MINYQKSRRKAEVFKYFSTNFLYTSSPNRYKDVMEKFNIDRKRASAYWIEYQSKMKTLGEKLEQLKQYPITPKESFKPVNYTEQETSKILNQTGNQLTVDMKTETEVKSLEDLLLAVGVDENEWEVKEWSSRKWDVKSQNNYKETVVTPLFSISAKFKKRDVETDLEIQKQILLSELFQKAPEIKTAKEYFLTDAPKTQMLELALFDMHFGKLAHREEVGEDYDITIACERYETAVKSLLSRVNLNRVASILLPIGQDLINIDNLTNSTTSGTPQDTDSRFHKIVKTVKAVLIKTINELSTIAPVDVVISVGNHDEQTSFMLGEILEAYYHNADNVNVYNGAHLRKYHQWGVNSIMFTHGNRERFQDLGMIFAAENPILWAATSQRFIQIGHYHHNKKIANVQAEEFQGFQVQIMPSLSGTDAWHKGKGYNSLKQAKAFLFDYHDGLVGEFTHSVK